jgi:hypothetical protein
MIELPSEVIRTEHKLDNAQTSEFTEHSTNPMWWCGKGKLNNLDFTTDPTKAVTFPTKECAEYVFGLICMDVENTRTFEAHRNRSEIITEHSWLQNN